MSENTPTTSTVPSDDLNAQLLAVQQKLSETNKLRDPIISKLYAVVSAMEIDPVNTKASVLEQQIGLITKLDDLLKSKEGNEISSVKLSLNKKNSDSLTNMSELAVNMLRKIAPGTVMNVTSGFVSEDISDAELEQRIKDDPKLAPINEDEMAMSELPPQ